MNKSCKRYLSGLHNDDLWNLVLNCVDKLIDNGDVFYLHDDNDSNVDEGLYFKASCESLIKENNG